MTDYTGKIIRIPGGSSFAGQLPRFSQRSAYLAAMATVPFTPTPAFDVNAGGLMRLKELVPCMMLTFSHRSSSSFDGQTLRHCDTGLNIGSPPGWAYPSGTYSTISPNGIKVPTLAGGFPSVGLPNLPIAGTAFISIRDTAGDVLDYRLFFLTTGVLTPGTLIGGNQWYCTTSWVSTGMYYQLNSDPSGVAGSGSATVEAGIYLIDFSAGLLVTPTVTLIQAIDTWSFVGSGSALFRSIPAGSMNVPMGTSLPSQFVIALGVISTALTLGPPVGGDLLTNVFIEPVHGFRYDHPPVAQSASVIAATDFTTNITQAP
jgi:hypothetical protein